MKRVIVIIIILVPILFSCSNSYKTKNPNVVIIFLDDSGWADFEPFRETGIKTPQVSRLAAEGCTYKNFYVPQAICSASRAALLTGCYPGRTGVFNAHAPRERGLEPEFATMSEVFKNAGYKTGFFGKWHCGDQEDTRPHNRGFDETFGLMYSNDMWRYHPENPEFWGKYPLQLWENGKVIIEDVTKEDQKSLTKWYTEHAIDFIKRNKEEPFFLYVPHSMPHVPLFCSKEFEGKSGNGLYSDVIMELDWSVGEINKALKDNGVSDNTIIIFTSDNGPWISYGNHAGQTPFREAKATSFEGGVRSACIIKYPPQIGPNETSQNTFFSIDLMPTLCDLAGIPYPENSIDGKNVIDLITNKQNLQPLHEYYAISTGSQLESIISGDGQWKLHIPHKYRTLKIPGADGIPGKYIKVDIDTSLYDLNNDPYESTNVKDDNPEVAKMLLNFAKNHNAKFYSKR